MKNKELELARLKGDLERGKKGMLSSHMSGFSIGESEADKLKN